MKITFVFKAIVFKVGAPSSFAFNLKPLSVGPFSFLFSFCHGAWNMLENFFDILTALKKL